jgi:hypothetical protein
VAFLDGIQRYAIVAYAGSSPLVAVELAAGVLERRDRRLLPVVVERRRFMLGRPEALSAAGTPPEGYLPLVLPGDDLPHPIADLRQAQRAVDDLRGKLETAVALEYRRHHEAWLVMDGALSAAPGCAALPKTIGVSKSHATLPFAGEALECYLRLPAGHRSPVFQPDSGGPPIHSWGLRFWPWEGKDLLYGLVRVEVAAAPDTTATADRVSRWLLAERAPVSTPDPRWDRLVYGIHAVEEFLKVTSNG